MEPKTTEIILKPRKHPRLWQAYLFWRELMEMRKRHLLRISAIERGASGYDAGFEQEMMDDMAMDTLLKKACKIMKTYGATLGPIWKWGTAIKGLGEGGLLAQVLAQIDDIGNFATVSKLWRFAGYAVIDGQRETNKAGEKSHYNKLLKSAVYLVVDQFIKQQTPVYVDLYYEEKAAQRRAHPEALCRECGVPWEQCKSKNHGNHKVIFNDGHIHARAMRKVGKLFLSHLWVVWRESEGLRVTLPYAQAILGHDHYVTPPMPVMADELAAA